MSDLNPPDEPLDPATRARLRARVVSGLDATDRPARGWLVPVAASVAIGALVVGVVLLGGSDGDRDVAPAGRGDTTSPVPVEPTPTPTPEPEPAPPTPDPSGAFTEGATTLPPGAEPEPETEVVDQQACDRETRGVLPGAAPAYTVEGDGGFTTFYVAGDRFTLCHNHGGRATVHHAKPLAGGGQANPFEVSSLFTDGGGAAFVAGGPVAQGAGDFTVAYEFPDGHVEESTVVGDADARWWLMVYRVEKDPGITPIRYTVRGTGESGSLEFPDVCAQATHGC